MPAGFAAPFVLTLRLWWTYWPQLVALVLVGLLARELLLRLAAHAGFLHPLAGLAMLTLVVLAHLVVVVMMFQLLLPGLPAVRAAQARARGQAAPGRTPAHDMAAAVTVALLPFFAYYAAWGLLGSIVRQYSRLALDLDPFGHHGNVLEVLDSRWLPDRARY